MLAEYLPSLLLAWSIQIMGVISPGPSVALIMGIATTQGRAPAVLTALGVACGSIVLSVATVLGITAIFAQIAEVMIVIKLVGAAYLAFLAFKAFKSAANPVAIQPKHVREKSIWRAALAGFFLQVSNPKAIFFWLAIASIGGVADAPWPIIALFIAGAFTNSFLGHGIYALLLSSTPIRHSYNRFRRWIDGTLGCFFVFASVKLATSRI
jgi:threonine/homoserine/homoserine lactone efflux protein